MIINHNMASLNTYRQMTINEKNSASSLEKLSSGLRINKAGDDAAGLAISEKMRGQIRGLDQASRNAQDGISLIQTAEGALNETHSILQRMRELAVQSSNDTTTDADRANIQKEVNQLADEINRIGNSTEFNTKKLINGDVSTNIAEGAKLVGGDLGSSFTLIAAATKGTATGQSITGAVNIHGDTNGYATGNIKLDNATLGGGSITIDSDNNELTLTVDGAQKTVVLDLTAQGGTSLTFDGSTASETSADLVGVVQDAIDAAYGGGKASVSLDSDGYLKITDTTSAGANSKVTIDGGNAVGTLIGTAKYSNGTLANDVLSFKLDGAVKSITLTDQVYNTPTDLMNELNAGGTSGVVAGVTFSLDGNALVATSDTTGSASKVTDFNGTAAADLKLFGANEVIGQDENDKFEIDINGTTKTVTVSAATYTDMDVFAAAVQSAINTAYSGSGQSVSVTNSNGNLTLQDNKTGSTSSITITDGTAATADQIAGAKAIGFTSATADNTADSGIDGSDKALKMQIGANKGQEMAVAINDMRSAALGISNRNSATAGITAVDGTSLDVSYGATSKVTNGSTTEYVLNVSTHDAAKQAISVVDNAIAKVSSERANLGAFQNRLEHTINNLGTSSENLTAAESRIRDVDMAKEMSNFQKNNILQQAAQAMLAQANQQPQGVLQLLR